MPHLYLTIHSLQAPLGGQNPPLRLVLTPHLLPPTSLPPSFANAPFTHYPTSTTIRLTFSSPEPPHLRLHVLAVEQHRVSSVGSALLPLQNSQECEVELQPYGSVQCSVCNQPPSRDVHQEFIVDGLNCFTSTMKQQIQDDADSVKLGAKLTSLSQSPDFRKKEEPLSCPASPDRGVAAELARQQELNAEYRRDLERNSAFQRRMKQRLLALK